jgi:hypothetical protein
LLAPTPRTPPNHCPCLHSHMKIDYYRLSTELMVELAPSASMVVPEEEEDVFIGVCTGSRIAPWMSRIQEFHVYI